LALIALSFTVFEIMDQPIKNDRPTPPSFAYTRADFAAGLYCVATPIGNMRDITLRALDVLNAADLIACEDTRHSRRLLNAYEVQTSLTSYHDFSDTGRRDELLSRIRDDELMIALISDAGTPLIADPGYKLVRACVDAGLYVTSIPGASAGISALQLSGLPTDAHLQLGFLPNKSRARQQSLQTWRDVPATLIVYENTARLKAMLADAQVVLGDRQAAIVREVTKRFEEVRRGPLSALIDTLDSEGAPKGEIVCVIEGAGPGYEEDDDGAHKAFLRLALAYHMPTRQAAAMAAKYFQAPRKDMYNAALAIRDEGGDDGQA
jgi:16S rRNA (cytidine1402-2'-O)-methyltransferase